MTNPDFSLLPDDLVQATRARLGSPVANQMAVNDAERILAMPLPGPLRDFYMRVGNGNADSFLGLAGGGDFFDGRTAPELYASYMQDDPDADPEGRPDPWWRSGVLPFFYWGCVVFTAVDCATPDAKVIGFDEGEWVPDGRPLAEWLAAWAAGAVTQPAGGLSRSPRPSTDAG